jgi:hypothetical protein
LALEGDQATQWDAFRRNLIDSGILLVDRSDELIWTGGDMSRQIIVKNVYEALSNKLWRYKIGEWRRKLWTWDCPLKLNLFVWLLVEQNLNLEKFAEKRLEGGAVCVISAESRENQANTFLLIVYSLFQCRRK